MHLTTLDRPECDTVLNRSFYGGQMNIYGIFQYRNIEDTATPRVLDRGRAAVSNELKMVVHVAIPRPADRRGRLPNLPLSVPQYNEEFSKISLCEAGRHPRQGNLLTIPYMHMCSNCNLQVMGFRSSCPAPSADEMDFEKQVRSVHDRDDTFLSNGCIGR